MALYKDGNPVSGINSIPRLTLAQYNALSVKPEFWVRTDAPEDYGKISADQVSYDSNNTVKDKLDVNSITTADLQLFVDSTKVNIYKNGNMAQVSFLGAKVNQVISQYGVLINFLPKTLTNGYCAGYVFKKSGSSLTPLIIYMNPNTEVMRIDGTLATTDEIFGNLIYMCQ